CAREGGASVYFYSLDSW
nr:immunoglobulin heavy chain junction region [Macaca mulatta]